MFSKRFAMESRRKRKLMRSAIYPVMVRTKTGQLVSLGKMVPSEQKVERKNAR